MRDEAAQYAARLGQSGVGLRGCGRHSGDGLGDLPEPAAASATLLLMSFVVAAWSRTAVAMPPWYWLISSMTDEIRPIAPIASELSDWIASIRRAPFSTSACFM